MKAESKQIQQGTPEWHQHRARHFNASDAAAMLGLSPYKTRAELLREKATGVVPEIDAATQRRFDRGHEIEALARPIAERIICSELYPVVLSADVDGLPLSASLDGLTMLETEAFECKTLNANLAETLGNGHIPVEYWPQMEQGLMLSGADRCLFMASDGTEENTLWAWYESKPETRRQLLSGWKQFAEDVANYQHVETAPEVVGATVEGLPAPFIQVEGRVVASNMGEFRLAAQQFLDRLPVATALETDQDFADADKAVKACKEAEDKLALVKQQAQAQAVEIDEVFRALDQISAQIRDARLALDKAVTKRKDDIRVGLVMDANKELAEHVKKLNARMCGEWMPVVDGEFQTAIKGRKTLSGLRDALDTAMAKAKIESNEIADTIERNAKSLDHAGVNSYMFLFPDFKQVCTKAPEDFANLLAARIRQHQERIEAEARAKAEQDQRGKDTSTYMCEQPDTVHLRQNGGGQQAVHADARAMPATEVLSTPPDNGARMKLGDINARLGFTVTADFLARLGFEPVAQEKNAKLYRECDFHGICAAIIRHVQARVDEYKGGWGHVANAGVTGAELAERPR